VIPPAPFHRRRRAGHADSACATGRRHSTVPGSVAMHTPPLENTPARIARLVYVGHVEWLGPEARRFQVRYLGLRDRIAGARASPRSGQERGCSPRPGAPCPAMFLYRGSPVPDSSSVLRYVRRLSQSIPFYSSPGSEGSHVHSTL